MFLEILKYSLKLMKKNLNLTQLIFILFVIVTLFLPALSGVKMNIKVLPMIIIFFLFLCAFFAGLFFAFRKSIEYDKDSPIQDDSFELSPLYFSEFFQGAGKYTVKFILAGVFLILLLLGFTFVYYYIIRHYLIIPDKISGLLNPDILSNETKLTEYVSTFTQAEQTQIGKLSLFTLLVMFLYGYLTMLYPTLLVLKEDNFFKSFFVSLKCLFKNLPVSILIFLFFNIFLALLNMISIAAVNNLIISVFVILFQCYVNVWYILSLFVYYEKVK